MQTNKNETRDMNMDMDRDKKRDNTLYYVSEVQSEARNTLFILDQAKQGCDTIMFRYNEGAELKNLLLNLFQNGKPFDFRISEVLPDNRCEIKGVMIPYV